MDVANVCEKYQRKMWSSMISRKKLPFSIWDAIELSNDNVYYMPYSGSIKFEVHTRFCLKCNKELVIKFVKTKFTAKTCECSSDGKTYITIGKLTTIFELVDATKIIKELSNIKTRNLPNKIQKWVSMGYSENEASEIVRSIQTSLSKKSPAARPNSREFSVRCIEYWVKKGYSVDDAKSKIANMQIGNGLKWYVSRYGEFDGKIKYESRINSWIASYNQALERDPTIMERKLVKFGRASKESLNILQPLYDKYKNKLKIYIGIDDNVEYFLRVGKTLFFYDFTIPELKLIVEYNGSAWHPNTTVLTETQMREWRGIFNSKSAEEIVAIDDAKKKLAELNGYTVIVVWDTDDVNASIALIENIIEGKI